MCQRAAIIFVNSFRTLSLGLVLATCALPASSQEIFTETGASFTDARGFTTDYQLNELGNNLNSLDSVNRTTLHLRNNDGRATQSIRPNGSVITRSFDQLGNRTIEREEFNTATVSQTFNTDYSLVTSITNPRDNTLTIERDEFGNATQIINALGHTSLYEYDSRGLVTRMVDPNGLETINTYNSLGLLETVTEIPPFGPGNTRTSQFEYNAFGLMSRAISPEGVTLDYTYDNNNRLLSVTDNLNQTLLYIYDVHGNLVTSETRDPDSTLVSLVENIYDLRNRLVETRQPHEGDEFSVVEIGLDGESNPIAQLDPRLNTSSDEYDQVNRHIGNTDREGGISSYTYDTNDRITSVTAANGVATVFEYDVLGRLLREISPDRGTITYTYDLANNITSITDGRGITATYTYDELERPIAITYPDSTENITLIYDNCTFGIGRLCSRIDESGEYNFTYDAFGNLITHTKTELGTSYTTEYSYDNDDNIVSTIYPSGRIVAYGRDELRRLSSLEAEVDGSLETIISDMQYRADDLMTSCTYGNGLLDTRGYDLQGRLVNQSTGTVDSRTYRYDTNSNLIDRNSTPQNSDYAYDAKDRLVSDIFGSESYAYTYDPNDNRLTSLINLDEDSYDYITESNQLLSIDTAVRQYDASGNLIDDGVGKTYIYNDVGRLTEAYVDGILVATYIYNANGQRTRKILADGDTIIYHYNQDGWLISENLANGESTKEYLWDDMSPVAQIDTNGAEEVITYIHTDHLYSPRFGTDLSGEIVWRWEGDGFAANLAEEDTDENGIIVEINLRLAGQYIDKETFLYYNWHRYYDPITGRYISSDPIGLNGGLNSFGYSHQNPIINIDPEGRAVPIVIIRGIYIGYKAYENSPCFVYALVDCNARIVYIGISKNPWLRVYGHNSSSGVIGKHGCQDQCPVNMKLINRKKGRLSCRKYEKRLIKRRQGKQSPIWNTQHSNMSKSEQNSARRKWKEKNCCGS